MVSKVLRNNLHRDLWITEYSVFDLGLIANLKDGLLSKGGFHDLSKIIYYLRGNQ